MEKWVRNPVKRTHNASIIWKAIITAFPLVGMANGKGRQSSNRFRSLDQVGDFTGYALR
jgi:hypothetical protein